MATSPYNDTEFILDFLGRLIWDRPARILDVGAGFGRWGYLCRLHLGGGVSLTNKPDQKLIIDAIEPFPGNVSPLYDCIYDHVFVGDALREVGRLQNYDVVICSHMIEHLAKSDALHLMDELLERTEKVLILALPLGVWEQGDVGGNSYERHLSVWSSQDFMSGGASLKGFGSRNKQNAVVIFPVSAEARWHVSMLKNPLKRIFYPLWVKCFKPKRVK